MTFFSRLESRTREIDSLLCVGLDPHPQDLDSQSGETPLDFCLRLIKATSDIALAYKPNVAFFEALGSEGWDALQAVIAAIPDDIPVLIDAKRGDIASTAQAYARAIFQTLGADAVTINPYLGHDSIQPFIKNREKGVFLLCKTSNPGAADLQDLLIATDDRQPTTDKNQFRQSLVSRLPFPLSLYEYVAHLAQSWNTNDNIGLVVGATQLDALARVREAAPNLWFLAPGVGAQGGDIAAALGAGLRADGMGMLIPVSRGISRAEDPRQAARNLLGTINDARTKISDHQSLITSHQSSSALADSLLEIGCIRFGEFTLKSGLQSPIYIDLRRLAAVPKVLAQAAAAYLPILRNLDYDHIAALPYAGMPIGTAISLQGGWPMVYPRKESKSYGTKALVEGVFKVSDKAVIVDDVISTGGSKLEGIEKLTAAGLQVTDIVVLVDRSLRSKQDMANYGYRLHSVFLLPHLLDYWEREDKVDTEKITAVRDFLLEN